MYRVQVLHPDPDHPNAEPAHIGPAFDESYADMARHFRGGEEVDLLVEARAFADQCRAESDGDDVFEVVELVVDADVGDVGTFRVVEDQA